MKLSFSLFNTKTGANTNSSSDSPVKRAFISGCGRAILGVDQMKGKGALIDSDIIMKKLV